MSDTCNKNKEDGIDQLANFAKSIIKAFILISVVVSIYYLKDKYLVEHMVGIPAISLIMFILLTTVLLTIVGVTDMYVFNNIILGIGIGLGFHLFN